MITSTVPGSQIIVWIIYIMLTVYSLSPKVNMCQIHFKKQTIEAIIVSFWHQFNHFLDAFLDLFLYLLSFLCGSVFFLLISLSFLPFMFFQAKCMRWCLLLLFCIFCLSRLFHLSRLCYRLCVSCTFCRFFLLFSWTIAVMFALWSRGSFPGLALRKARTIPTGEEYIS